MHEEKRYTEPRLTGASLTESKLESSATPQTGQISASPVWNDLFGLSGTKALRSKTFTFTPDPWTLLGVQGAKFYVLSSIRFTILTDGTTTSYTLSWTEQSLGWTTKYSDNQAPDLFVEVKNSAGGVVDSWDIGRQHFLCLGGPTVFNHPNAQNTFDIASNILVYPGASNWYKIC